ncbi:MAG: cyclic nucleotide-binding domain-containing protein [Pseudomonadota bacterium]|nr:cyclic nucleotide-binding domain-containing protein [Pseudomonadota bacterium]
MASAPTPGSNLESNLDLDALAEGFRRAHELPAKDTAAIAALLASCAVRLLETRQVLFREREEGTGAYFLLRGRIGVARRDPRGVLLYVSTLEAPALLGHMSLVDGSPRSATCTALGPCVVAEMDRTRFRGLVDSGGPRGSALRRLLISAMSVQLKNANSRILTIIDPPPEAADDETTEHGIEEVTRVLEGWKP